MPPPLMAGRLGYARVQITPWRNCTAQSSARFGPASAGIDPNVLDARPTGSKSRSNSVRIAPSSDESCSRTWETPTHHMSPQVTMLLQSCPNAVRGSLHSSNSSASPPSWTNIQRVWPLSNQAWPRSTRGTFAYLSRSESRKHRPEFG